MHGLLFNAQILIKKKIHSRNREIFFPRKFLTIK